MKKLTALILSAIIGLSLVSAPTFAATKGESCRCPGDPEDSSKWSGKVTVDTSILSGCDCSEKGGPSSITNILLLVVDIMTIGIGILGVIGISIVGVQYLTAGGSEEKTRKAKRRMFEIIIGLVAYAVIYALLKFLNVQPEAEPGQSSLITIQNILLS